MLCFFSNSRAGDEPTALGLVSEGNRYVGEQAKDRIVQIRSEKSIGGLVPNIWYVVYYDPTATFKAVEVKFGAGKMMDVKRPLRLLEPVTGGQKELDRKRIKIDSDKAIEIASKEALIQKLDLKSVQLKLERGEGEQPVWKVKFWASKLRKPSETVDIGEIHVNAEDGKVGKLDLHIDRVD